MTKDIPAFPTTPTGEIIPGVKGGMTLRDYFAAKAMQAMLSDGFSDDIPNPDYVKPDKRTLAIAMAENSYKFADAMLVQREKES